MNAAMPVARCLVLGSLVMSVPIGDASAQGQPKPVASSKNAPKPIQPAVQPRPADIDRTGVSILVKSAMIALDQANKTGNYTVLRDLGSPDFQVNTAARLAEIFSAQRTEQLDFAGVLVLDPQLTLQPQIEPNGMLHMAGFFPSVPKRVNFEILWQPVNRQWRLFGLSVNLSDGSPVAPESLPAPRAEETAPPQAPTGAVTGAPDRK